MVTQVHNDIVIPECPEIIAGPGRGVGGSMGETLAIALKEKLSVSAHVGRDA